MSRNSHISAVKIPAMDEVRKKLKDRIMQGKAASGKKTLLFPLRSEGKTHLLICVLLPTSFLCLTMSFGRYAIFSSTEDLSLVVRIRRLKAHFGSGSFYISETWTVGIQEKRRLISFRLWCYRKTLKLSWRNRMTNENVL